ncbi:MAG: VOC family protein [Spirulina sp. SIO3F2]|nr:VOC family protein [Spirulina sp. SIO3F2]
MSNPSFQPEQFQQVIPIFRIFDVPKAKEFYLDYLGFNLDWEQSFEPDTPLYLQISLGKIVLHLSEHHGDCCPGATAVVETQDLASYHAHITAKHYKYLRPGLELAPWNAQVMEVIDPFGNRLRFNEDLDSSARE